MKSERGLVTEQWPANQIYGIMIEIPLILLVLDYYQIFKEHFPAEKPGFTSCGAHVEKDAKQNTNFSGKADVILHICVLYKVKYC